MGAIVPRRFPGEPGAGSTWPSPCVEAAQGSCRAPSLSRRHPTAPDAQRAGNPAYAGRPAIGGKRARPRTIVGNLRGISGTIVRNGPVSTRWMTSLMSHHCRTLSVVPSRSNPARWGSRMGHVQNSAAIFTRLSSRPLPVVQCGFPTRMTQTGRALCWRSSDEPSQPLVRERDHLLPGR